VIMSRNPRFHNDSDLPVHFVESKGMPSACGKQIRMGRKTDEIEHVTCSQCIESDQFKEKAKEGDSPDE